MRYSYVTAGASPRPTMRFFHGSLREGAAAGGEAGGECGRKEVQSRKPCEARAPSVTAMPCHLPPGGRQCPLRHAPRATSPKVRGILLLRRKPKLPAAHRAAASHLSQDKTSLSAERKTSLCISKTSLRRKTKLHFPQSGKLHLPAGACSRRVFHMAISLDHKRMIFVI